MTRLLRSARIWVFLVAGLPGLALAQPAPDVAPPALEAIQVEDLRTDLFELASDEMRGRRAGTLDELRAAAWLAEKARAAGLEPAGDDGTYFQFFHIRRNAIDADASHMTIGGRALALGREAIFFAPMSSDVDAPAVRYEFGVDVRGKVAVIEPPPAAELSGVREDMAAIQHFANQVFSVLPMAIAGGAAAIIAVPDSITARDFETLALLVGSAAYSLEGDASAHVQVPVPIAIVHPDVLPRENLDGRPVEIRTLVSAQTYPSVNVVARAPGSDAALAGEHVLFSAHLDHDGTAELDGELAIWNGADDNGSGSVALLAIGRAFVQEPARRSALFVWHGAEERGLLGSRLFAREPTVNREGIVAVLNADMIGRNHPDTTALLGMLPGNRNSRELADAALSANEAVGGFVIDQSWDEPDHPERFWMRSDHFPYVMLDYPALFFTTGLHPDYHTPNDTPDLIDYDKLARMARWIYATGWLVASADQRPALDR